METGFLTHKTGLIPQNESRIQDPPYALPFETIIHGKYLIGKVLGFGGFGITYQGINIETNEFVAIKEYYPDKTLSRYPGTTYVVVSANYDLFAREKERFLEEARIIYHCQSKHILKIYSLFEENGTAYYVMEFLEGRDLNTYLKSMDGCMEWRELGPIVNDVLDALNTVHSNGIIHRDISPDNIFLCSDNTAKIIDFGTARSLFNGRSKSVILKKGFAPIEQYSSRGTQGPWTDIYALGATIYRALTGIVPPEAPERQFHDEIRPLAEFHLNLPVNVENAIMRALNVRETDRYQSVEDFKKELIPAEPSPVGFFASLFKKTPPNPEGIYESPPTDASYTWAKLNPTLTGLSGTYAGQIFQLDQDIIFGRDPSSCNIVFPDTSSGVSRVHCQICLNAYGQKAVIIDCNSTYGTYVNGVKLYPGQPAVLQTGSVINFGEDNAFSFSL